ncbi:uncharacterized protein ACOB8E_019762 isoform 2-T4 [Sarcophilus harrisii]
MKIIGGRCVASIRSLLRSSSQKQKIKVTPISDDSTQISIPSIVNGDSDLGSDTQESPRPSHPAPVVWESPVFWRSAKVAPQGENHTEVAGNW